MAYISCKIQSSYVTIHSIACIKTIEYIFIAEKLAITLAYGIQEFLHVCGGL